MTAASKAVFLSYAHEDAVHARKIAEALRAAGVEVWFDQSELRGGDAWDAKIRKQIKECSLFLPVVSANTQTRTEGYFRLEWKLAVDRSHLMAEDAPFIVPIVVDDTAQGQARVPEKFLERQWMGINVLGVDEVTARIAALLGGETTRPAPTSPAPTPKPLARRPVSRRKVRWLAPLLALAAIAIAASVWYYRRTAAFRWAHDVALPQIARHIDRLEYAEAFALARRVEQITPHDATLQQIWPRISFSPSIHSTPPGAEVAVKAYRKSGDAWQRLGVTPLTNVRLPLGFYRWQFTKEGHVPTERAERVSTLLPKFDVILPAAGSVPPGMVQVSGTARVQLNLASLEHLPRIDVPGYFIDKFEVTNRQFKAFVDGHGYTNPAHWVHPFREGDRTLTPAEAMARFVDRTGRAGPATWSNGTFPEGEADRPVTGVSWYEAAAYAASVNKRLPSVYHWSRAASGQFVEHFAPLSNFSNRDLAAVGAHAGMSMWGAYDMAGNAKEWCANEADGATRYLLGGGWRDPEYQFTAADAQPPFDRGAANGFRCIAPMPGTSIPPEFDLVVTRATRDYAVARPVSDEVFATFRGVYAYDKGPLDPRIEQEDDSDIRWHKSRVTVNAAYGNERLPLLLFRPRTFSPPYQAVIYYPGSGALTVRSSERLERLDLLAAIVASGRMVVFPIYKSTYERGDAITSSIPDSTRGYREHVVQWSNDFSRAVDYLETRKDLQADKLAFLGMSWGARLSSVLLAMEPRIKVSVLASGGFRSIDVPPQVDELNFAPRVRVPTLMVNGRYDFTFPREAAQEPMFRLLNVPTEQKQHLLFDYAHSLPSHLVAREAITWLDRYLGAVK